MNYDRLESYIAFWVFIILSEFDETILEKTFHLVLALSCVILYLKSKYNER